MSSGNQYERIFKLWATVAKLVVDGKRSITKVIDFLQSVVSEQHLEEYFTYAQKRGNYVRGPDIYNDLRERRLLHRVLLLEDKLVDDWRKNPSSYPKEFRDKTVTLWGSLNYGPPRSFSGGSVATLVYERNQDNTYIVRVKWRRCLDIWGPSEPAILSSQV